MTVREQLAVTALSVSYGRRKAIDGLSLAPILAGSVTALVGPNGAGKSTILKALAQIVPSTGALLFGSTNLRLLKPRERAGLIGFMPQALPQGTELTVIESVIVAMQGAVSNRGLERQAVAVLQRLNIVQLSLSSLDQLSGGERQLVSLAQAIARSPSLLFLDEPTSALDLARQLQVMQQVRALAEEGAAVIMVLHDLSLAARWADQVIVLDRGQLYATGSPQDVLTPAMLADVYGVHARVERIGDQVVVLPESAVPPRSTV
jgi:iron complex transport system ATP-binding protein